MILKIIKSKAFEFVSNNLSLLLGIPTLIGGIKQLYELTNLSPLLYKFFSFSQLIIDGFIILIQIVLLYFFYILYEVFVETLTNPSGSQRKRMFKLFSFVLFIILFLVLISFIILKFKYNFEKTNYYIKVLSYLAIILFILNLINLNIALKKEGIVLFYFALFFGFVIFPEPNNSIENFTILTKKINKNYSKAKLVYFNDQYIFYEISRDKYLVKKIDDLFESNISK
ncbi:hypothetical protein [Chryseobacterium sp.]|uniref:hypothetical protein n=1 Tax=Chryseobacterium sp. TaxID=1871047 RepID=UPI0035C69F09